MDDLLYADETHAIRGAIFDVSREMGIGFLEAVYQECLALEFARRDIPFAEHRELAIVYKGQVLETVYKPDFICFGKIIVELKTADSLVDGHKAQVLNYLKASRLRLGLLVNFGQPPKAIIERIVV